MTADDCVRKVCICCIDDRTVLPENMTADDCVVQVCIRTMVHVYEMFIYE